jgi:hypothetical protein
VLATSDKLKGAVMPTTEKWIRFQFREPVSLTAATQYHLVLTGDWTASDAVYIAWREDASAASYANGSKSTKAGGTWSATATSDFSFKIYVRENETEVTLPATYTSKALVGYVYNDSGSNLDPFMAHNRRVVPLEFGSSDIVAGFTSTFPDLQNVSAFIPPTQVWFSPWMKSAAGTQFDFTFGPVPDGYTITAGHRSGGAARVIMAAGGASEQHAFEMAPIFTGTQGVYISTGAGSIDDLSLSWYEW